MTGQRIGFPGGGCHSKTSGKKHLEGLMANCSLTHKFGLSIMRSRNRKCQGFTVIQGSNGNHSAYSVKRHRHEPRCCIGKDPNARDILSYEFEN